MKEKIDIILLKEKALKFPESLTSLDIDRHNMNILKKNVKKIQRQGEE
ncbi:MAG: hypothetical protein AMDU4_FER2C00010G0005 [Ferroplasma sp. Type II]|nr:hypothetical protein [Ferroplasma sp. Type II]EQB74424.1 MAG: hypothetical protein AMDU4_FER2C00010G0005 [Ferroplasma sp. Type II]